GASPVDLAFLRVELGDHAGFAEWVRLVEPPLRASLRSLARQVDAEAIVQEGLLRMWVLAPTLHLTGENASLRFALRVVRNLALPEARRHARVTAFDPDALEAVPETAVAPTPPRDPALRSAIARCLSRLPERPRQALLARLEGHGETSDRALAERLRMSLNTFLQNIVRARRHLAECLASQGIELPEVRP